MLSSRNTSYLGNDFNRVEGSLIRLAYLIIRFLTIVKGRFLPTSNARDELPLFREPLYQAHKALRSSDFGELSRVATFIQSLGTNNLGTCPRIRLHIRVWSIGVLRQVRIAPA